MASFDAFWQNYILIVANSVDRYRRDAYDDASRQFDKTRRNIEDGLGMDDMCVVDGDCPGNPITECDHEGSMMNTAVGKCRFVWWFYLILILVALAIIGCILSCVCMPCCCLYECLRKLCCCCCWWILVSCYHWNTFWSILALVLLPVLFEQRSYVTTIFISGYNLL